MRPREVVIRPRLFYRVFTLGFGVVWCGIAVAVGYFALRDGAPLVMQSALAAMAGLGVAGFWRNLTLSVKTSERGIRVRNVFRTVEVPWVDIEDIRMVLEGAERRNAVRLVRRDGSTVPINVLSGDPESAAIRGRRQLAALAQLRNRHPGLR